MHRLFRRPGRAFAAVAVLLLAGCGQTGPLYLPPPQPPKPAAPPPAAPAESTPPAQPAP